MARESVQAERYFPIALTVLLAALFLPGFVANSAGGEKKLELIVEHLVTTHPRKEIREDLDRLIRAGMVLLGFAGKKGLLHDGDVTLFLVEEDGALKPVLGFSRKSLADSSISEHYWYGAILHMYELLRQLAEGRAPPELFIPYPADFRFNQEGARQFLRTKLEATLAECNLAEELGSWQEVTTCVSYKEGGLPAMLLKIAENHADRPHFALVRDYLFELAEEFAREKKGVVTK